VIAPMFESRPTDQSPILQQFPLLVRAEPNLTRLPPSPPGSAANPPLLSPSPTCELNPILLCPCPAAIRLHCHGERTWQSTANPLLP